MSNAKMKYKGFIGDCQYSHFINAYSGSIVNANDLVTYDAVSRSELAGEFRKSVDSYIDLCASIGFGKLLDPKLFNISRLFILLKIFKNIFTLKYFSDIMKETPNKIFMHNNFSCEVDYSKKNKMFSGIITRGGIRYRIDARTLRELNETFVARTSNLNVVRRARRYITLERK